MRFFKIALIALTALVAPISVKCSDSSVVEEFRHKEQWQEFKAQYNKAYSTAEEEESRFQVFKDNLARAAQLSVENPLATFGVTRFSDLSPAEFQRQYLGFRPATGAAAVERLSRPVFESHAEVSPNANVDWRTSGAVTAVKDQGQCGSCWAFSAVEGVESAWFLKHKTLPVLSPQQVTSCDKTDAGCNGGDLPTAFAYIKSAGLTTEAAYPYTSGKSGATGTCKTPSSVTATITGFSYATPPCTGACTNQNEATLLSALSSTSPSSICVYADSWQNYVSGILSSTATCPIAYNKLDHCVQLVGYNGSGTTPYWIVRNSWGTSWGQDGYIYLKYGINVCGVADEATLVSSA